MPISDIIADAASWFSRSLTYMAHERARVHQMTKAELIAAIADAPDDTPIYILNPEDGRRRSRIRVSVAEDGIVLEGAEGAARIGK
jgi:hypothetical protein